MYNLSIDESIWTLLEGLISSSSKCKTFICKDACCFHAEVIVKELGLLLSSTMQVCNHRTCSRHFLLHWLASIPWMNSVPRAMISALIRVMSHQLGLTSFSMHSLSPLQPIPMPRILPGGLMVRGYEPGREDHEFGP